MQKRNFYCDNRQNETEKLKSKAHKLFMPYRPRKLLSSVIPKLSTTFKRLKNNKTWHIVGIILKAAHNILFLLFSITIFLM